jgi:predicted aconitase with swiveling domain
MPKTFKGRPVVPGNITANALVSRNGFNTLASFQKALMFKDKDAKCSDQNNPDIYEKPMHGAALCLPQTIGSTTGGMVIYCAAALGQQPACMLFSRPIDSLAAAGAILADVWTDVSMPVVDGLGEEFLAAVQTGEKVEVKEDGTVVVG